MKDQIKLLAILFLLTFSAQLYAQKKLSLNYYSDEVLNKIQVTTIQKATIKDIRSELDLKLSEIKNDLDLSTENRASKNREAYNTAYSKYNAVLSNDQQAIVRKLLFEIQVENVKNGFGTFHESAHFKKRMEIFKNDPLSKGGIIFLGNSITEQGDWKNLFPDKNVFNRGIGGDNTYGVLARLDEVISSKPEKIFLMIGINDLGSRQWETSVILDNYNKIVDKIKKGSPKTKLYVQSILPLNDNILKGGTYKNKADTIIKLNKVLKSIGNSKCAGFVDLYSIFHTGDTVLNARYTKDGIHLLPDGYLIWKEFLEKNKYL
ncbi:GDSL-type esterase/lipase family protein [Pedobacter sp. ASV1-7]|uniref:GDSL-type esterase/lipase family protein n=1 Tax=Pedobacter sp. ASV1-7 TaxID=3145237 RepID=UPI0032E933C7